MRVIATIPPVNYRVISILTLLSVQLSFAETVELIADRDFENGLTVIDHDGNPHVIQWNATASTPVWNTAQHHSKSSFADPAFQTFTPNSFSFRDDYEMLTIHPSDGQSDFICGVNGKNEFNGIWRAQGDPWPHLYLEQRISSPGGCLGTNAPSLADMERIDFSMSVKLLYDRKMTGPEYSRNRHAAQYIFFFTVQNLNRESYHSR